MNKEIKSHDAIDLSRRFIDQIDVHPDFTSAEVVPVILNKYERQDLKRLEDNLTLPEIYHVYARKSDAFDPINQLYKPLGRYVGRYGDINLLNAVKLAHEYMQTPEQLSSFRSGFTSQAAAYLTTQITRYRLKHEDKYMNPDETIDLYRRSFIDIEKRFDKTFQNQ